ncbi:MAG: class I adenylate-forming enzyme family protein, partial [Opitutaceae bacterium]
MRRRKVAMGIPNGIVWFQAFIGLLEAGAIPVLLDPGEPLAAQKEAALHLGASWLWTGTDMHALPLRLRVRREDLCLVKVTSGSTGRPRGLAFTHGQMLADGRQVCRSMGIREDDLNLAVIPFGHSYGLGNLVLPLIDQGTAIVCAESPLPSGLALDCAKWKPTVFPLVPSLMQALVRADLHLGDFSPLRLVIAAGGVISPQGAKSFCERFAQSVHCFYGSSDTGGISYD